MYWSKYMEILEKRREYIKKYFENYDKSVIDWFKDHIAEYEKINDDMEILRWHKSDTVMYSITYIRLAHRLIVVGDLYDAVYSWSGKNTLEWIAGCDLGYFASKCMASQYGRGNESWDSNRAANEFDKMINEHLMEKEQSEIDEFNEKWEDVVELGRGSTCSEFEWQLFYHDNMEFFHEEIGDDDYGYTNIGKGISICCEAHLVGLKLAIEQLINKKII